MLTNLKVYWKFLGRNRVYTAVTVAGFGVSLMFVIALGLYVRHELTLSFLCVGWQSLKAASANPVISLKSE